MKFVKLAVLTSALALAAGTVSAGEIAVIVKTTSSNFWQNVNKGASAAIEGQSEHTMSFDGPATESAISDQVNLVENAINRGVSGIVLAPSDPEALAPAVKRAFEAGIPVVIIDSALGDGAEGTYQAFLSTDNCAAGEQVAARMIEKAGTEGKVAIMSLGARLEEAKKAADQLEAKGLSTTVADLRFAKPLDTALIEKLMRSHEVVVTVEEGAVGGLGAHVLTFASDEGLTDNGLRVRTMRLPDTFQDHDDPAKQYDEAGLNAPHIVDTVLSALRHNSAGVEEARA